MTYNIMTEYVIYTKKFLEKFMKKYFQNAYNAKIAKEYIETYIEARYENYGGNESQRIFYRRIYSALKRKCEEMQYDLDEKELIKAKNMLEVYQYVFYIDFVRPLKIELKEFVKQIYEKRLIKFELENVENLQNELYQMIKKFREDKEKYLKKFESSHFELVTTKYLLVKDLYKVDLKYHFKLPYIFSDKAIEEVYNENVIFEDKIIIEYMMLTAFIIKMINEGKFNTLYLVDFPVTLFEKENKKEKVLKIISEPAIQERIRIKITNTNFEKHREEIYELMKLGYKFVLEVDDTFEVTQENIKKLSIFSYVIISSKLNNIEEFKQYESELENIKIDEG